MLRLALMLVSIRLLASEPCLPVAGSTITPQELGRLVPAFANANDPALALAAAPPPGQQLFVTAAELAAWGHRSGVPGEGWAPVCVVRPARRLTRSDVEEAIRPQLGSASSFEVIAYSPNLLPPGHAVFPLPGASKPSPLRPRDPVQWSGYWETTDGKHLPIWARVSAWRMRTGVRLKGAAKPGTSLKTDDLEQVRVATSALDAAPDERIEEYVGQLLRRFLPEGYLLNHQQVETPPRVTRNTMIAVHVISGQLHLELAARAESDGWVGKPVALLAPSGRRQFQAVVQPDGSALLVVRTRTAPPVARAEENNGSPNASN